MLGRARRSCGATATSSPQREPPEFDAEGRSSALLGATITAVELPTAFPYFAAIAAIVGSGLGAGAPARPAGAVQRLLRAAAARDHRHADVRRPDAPAACSRAGRELPRGAAGRCVLPAGAGGRRVRGRCSGVTGLGRRAPRARFLRRLAAIHPASGATGAARAASAAAICLRRDGDDRAARPASFDPATCSGCSTAATRSCATRSARSSPGPSSSRSIALPTAEYRERVLEWARTLAEEGLTAPGFPRSSAARATRAPTSRRSRRSPSATSRCWSSSASSSACGAARSSSSAPRATTSATCARSPRSSCPAASR